MSTASTNEPPTCDGSRQTTHLLLGRLKATLGRLTGQSPPSEEHEDTEPVLVAEDDEE